MSGLSVTSNMSGRSATSNVSGSSVTSNMSASSVTSDLSGSSVTSAVDIPPELMLTILSELPVKEIMRARRVSRHIRELIDHPTNQTFLFKPAQSRALARLQRTVKAVLDYDPSEGFWEIFRRFIAHKGITWYQAERRSVISVFLTQWEYRRSGKKPPYDQDTGIAFAHQVLRSELGNILQEHIECHVPDFKGIKGAYLALLDAGCCDTILEYLQTSQQVMQDVYRCIQDTPGGYLRGRSHWISLPERIPKWCLTKLECPGARKVYPRYREPFTAFSDIKLLVDLLGVPDITGHGPGFAYCGKTEWSFKCVKKAIERGEALSQYEKARVLEETFLF